MKPPLSALLQAAGAGQYDVLGELGADERGAAYLAREGPTKALVALQVTGGAAAPVVAVHRVLDANVPGRGVACPFCRGEVGAWSRYCQRCGGDLGAPPADAGDVLERVLGASAAAYEMLGDMPLADGGAPLRFARERDTREVVALTLASRQTDKTVPRTFELTSTRLGVVTPQGAVPARAAPDPPSDSAPGESEMICTTCGTEYPPGARFCVKEGLPLQPKRQSNDLIGQIIAGRYQLLRSLGEGGMGRVYLAEQVKMGRKCAVKVLHRELARSPESVARFSREAREAGRLDHPNIVQIHDFGEDASGLTYLAMEYVDGQTLAQVMHEAGPLPIARALAIAAQVAEALMAAHAAGLVHRDIKPENILVSARRNGSDLVKVVDFGIAKAVQHEGLDTLTRTGVAVGTTRYMSPEQLMADAVDGRSDVYACGCVLWEMLAGHPLWQGGAEEFARRLQESAPRVRGEAPQVPPALDDLVARTLEPRPAQRVSSAAELRDALEALLGGMSEGSRGVFRTYGAARPEDPDPGNPKTPTDRGRVVQLPAPGADAAALVSAAPSSESAAAAPSPGPAPAGSWLTRKRLLTGVAGLVSVAAVIGFIARRENESGTSAAPSGSVSQQVGAAPAPSPRTPPALTTSPATVPAAAAPPPTQPAPALGRVRLRGSLPRGAVVLVDGKRESRTDFEHPLSQIVITVRAPGYAELRQEATVEAGTNVIRLEPLQRLAPAQVGAASPAQGGTAATADPAARFSAAASAFVQRFADAISSSDPSQVDRVLGVASGAGAERAALDSVFRMKAKATAPTNAISATVSPPTVRFDIYLQGHGMLHYQADFLAGGSDWTLIKIRRTGR